ncbi:MAG: hypothetical protein QOE70_41 [Chthoniobacter sp.]|nr:hypothetical protein [Chthoniobacter sp.]
MRKQPIRKPPANTICTRMNPKHPDEPSSEQNPDPITGEPGSHPVATGIGAAAVGTAGLAAAAVVAGPIGLAAAAIGGAFIGGYVGKAVGEVFDPTLEEAYWRDQHPHQPYASRGTYQDFLEAYRTGFSGSAAKAGADETFEEAEAELRAEYGKRGGTIPWEDAREAARAAWIRARQRRAGASAE